MSDKMFFSKKIHLTTGDFDQYRRIRPYRIFDLFQEVALMHAEELGVGFDALLNQKKAWVLFRTKFITLNQPFPSSEVMVETWPLPGHKIEYRREYRITDLNNNVLIKGTSTWAVVNTDTLRVTRDPVNFEGEFFLATNFEESLDKIEESEASDNTLALTATIRPSDLDRYKHMNNAKYSELIYDALNLGSNEMIKQAQVNFIHELKFGDIVRIYKTKIDNKYYLIGKKDNSIAFQAYVKTNEAN